MLGMCRHMAAQFEEKPPDSEMSPERAHRRGAADEQIRQKGDNRRQAGSDQIATMFEPAAVRRLRYHMSRTGALGRRLQARFRLRGQRRRGQRVDPGPDGVLTDPVHDKRDPLQDSGSEEGTSRRPEYRIVRGLPTHPMCTGESDRPDRRTRQIRGAECGIIDRGNRPSKPGWKCPDGSVSMGCRPQMKGAAEAAPSRISLLVPFRT